MSTTDLPDMYTKSLQTQGHTLGMSDSENNAITIVKH